MRSAIVEDGVVTNVIVGEIDGSVACGDDVSIGWSYANGAFTAPPEPAPSKDDLLAYAAAVRYEKETGGFTFDSYPIATDRDSQSKIGNVALAATITGSSFSTEWKCSDGRFFTLTQATAVAMATAVMTFVSGCFGAENLVVGEINAGTITTRAEIDAAAWPAAA